MKYVYFAKKGINSNCKSRGSERLYVYQKVYKTMALQRRKLLVLKNACE